MHKSEYASLRPIVSLVITSFLRCDTSEGICVCIILVRSKEFKIFFLGLSVMLEGQHVVLKSSDNFAPDMGPFCQW